MIILKNFSKRLISLETELESFVFKNQKSISLKKEIGSSKNAFESENRSQILINQDRDRQKYNKNRSSSIVDRTGNSPKALSSKQ